MLKNPYLRLHLSYTHTHTHTAKHHLVQTDGENDEETAGGERENSFEEQ